MAAVQNVKFTTTQRGGDALFVDNYTFRVRMRVGLKKYWKCFESTCNVTAVTDGGVLVKNPDTPSHNHPSQELEVDRKEFKLNVLEEVTCIFSPFISSDTHSSTFSRTKRRMYNLDLFTFLHLFSVE